MHGHRAERRQHREAVRDLAHGNVIGAMVHEQRAQNIHNRHVHERQVERHLRQEERWQHRAAERDLRHGNVIGAMAHESAAERAHAANAAMHGRPFAAAHHQAAANNMAAAAAATAGAAVITGAAIATAAVPVVVGPPPPQPVVVVQPTAAPAMMAQQPMAAGNPAMAQPAPTAAYPAAPMAGYPAAPAGSYPAGAPMGMPVVSGGPVAAAPAGRPTVVHVEITGYTDYPGHTVYCIQTDADLNGTRLRFNSQQRFSAFAQLHDTLRLRQPAMARALPHDFPVPKALFNGGNQLKQERRAGLQQYLRVAVAAAPNGVPPPVLAKFLGI